jgi:hypothetical protein
MSNRRVLLLSTYPIAEPLHGGQRRVRAIFDCYRRCGWTAKSVSAFPSGWYVHHADAPERTELVMPRGDFFAANGLRPDLHICRYFDKHDAYRADFIETVDRFRPDVIQFEHPWMYPVIRDYMSDTLARCRVVYSSHNVEVELLQSILKEERHPRAADFCREVRDLEQSLVRAADATICVTESDAAAFRGWGAERLFIAPNGANRRPADDSESVARALRNANYALVTGSAHPPNCSGFLNVLGSDFAFVPPDAKVVIAGGMSNLLDSSLPFHQRDSMVRSRTIRMAAPEEPELNCLVNNAGVIILPITEGGGSNIKTAEALLSDRPIIATPTAMRGFDAFRESPGVTIEDDPGRFRKLVREALCERTPRATPRAGTDRLLWEHCVSDIPRTASGLFAA